jgi:hypothetical protein
LSAVDEELLARSEKKKQAVTSVRRTWEIGLSAAAALLILVGGVYAGVTYRLNNVVDSESGAPEMTLQMAVATETSEESTEECAVEESAIEESTIEESAVEECVTEESTAGMSEQDARSVEALGEYIPSVMPDGFSFLNAWLEDNVLVAQWRKEDTFLTMRISEESDMTAAKASQSFLPVYEMEELSAEQIPDGKFAVRFRNDILVEIDSDTGKEEIWQILSSIETR